MSISKSLLRAAKLQEKIDELRGQLIALLDQARAEVDSAVRDELEVKTDRRRPKMLKSTRAQRSQDLPVNRAHKEPRRSTGKRPVPAPATRATRRVSQAGKKRAASPSGPLAPAVVKVLQAKGQPMRVRDILAGLLADGYQFNASEPRKNLAARIYRLTGVKQVSAGLFGLA